MWGNATEGETAWTVLCEEFAYEADAVCDLARDTLSEMERLKGAVAQLKRVSDQYEGSSVLIGLAEKFGDTIRRDMEMLIGHLQSASACATYVGHVVDSMG